MQGSVDAIGARRLGNAGDTKDAESLPVLESTIKQFLIGLAEASVDDSIIALDEIIDIRSDRIRSRCQRSRNASRTIGPSRDARNSTPRNVISATERRSTIV